MQRLPIGNPDGPGHRDINVKIISGALAAVQRQPNYCGTEATYRLRKQRLRSSMRHARVASHLYEIPITLMPVPSRKHMPRLTNTSAKKTDRVFARAAPDECRREHPMLDLMLLALGLGFFVLTIGYVYACDRL